MPFIRVSLVEDNFSVHSGDTVNIHEDGEIIHAVNRKEVESHLSSPFIRKIQYHLRSLQNKV